MTRKANFITHFIVLSFLWLDMFLTDFYQLSAGFLNMLANPASMNFNFVVTFRTKNEKTSRVHILMNCEEVNDKFFICRIIFVVVQRAAV